MPPLAITVAVAVAVTACGCRAGAAVTSSVDHRGADLEPAVDLSQLSVPPGFIPVVTRGDGVDAFLGDPDLSRVAAWTFDDEVRDEMVLAEVEVFRRPAEPVPDPVAWSRALAARFAGDGTGAKEIERIFDYLTGWRDPKGRATAEWAWVTKGERVEIYEHLIADDAALWQVRLSVHPGAPPDLIAAWLTSLFDEPLRTGAPRGRRALRGLGSRR